MWNKVLVYPTNQLPIIVERSMMKEADSSGILQKLNKTCICTTSEINNDYATKDHSYTQNIVTIAQEITSMKKKKKTIKLRTKWYKEKDVCHHIREWFSEAYLVGRYWKHCCSANAGLVQKRNAWKTIWNSNDFILNVGANYLKSEKSSNAIAKEIINIAVFLKSETFHISVSNIIVHTNNQQLNLKAIKVNNHLVYFCKEMNFSWLLI